MPDVSEFQSHAGRGASGVVDGKRVAVGNRQLMDELQVSVPEVPETYLGAGETEIYVSLDNRFAGWIVVADPIKDTSLQAIRDLRDQGIRIVMLTGDNRATAENVAGKLGITEFEAEVLPEKKSDIVRRLQQEGRVVAMAGDGVNDAPALAAGGCWHCDGDGNRYRDGERGRNVGEGRPGRDCAGAQAERGDHAEYPAEPVLRVCLQLAGRADCGGNFVSDSLGFC